MEGNHLRLVTVDFDGTLFQGDSFNLMFKLGRKKFGISEWVTVIIGSIESAILGIFKGKNALRKHFFKTFAKTFKGKTQQELETFFDHLIELGDDDINQSLINQIKEHQAQGNHVMILSGALRPFLEALTERLELEVTIIGTNLIYGLDGKCTGETGAFINGDAKVAAVNNWLEELGKNAIETEIWAYADSESDIPLLRFSDHAIIVNPNEKMRVIAEGNNWPVFGEQ